MWGGHLVRPGRVRHPSHKSFFMHYFSLVSPLGGSKLTIEKIVIFFDIWGSFIFQKSG
ncbi:hypothetical protein FDUTEX481_04895 [Tolypothrix sp. PCC 7601]|nr:hypothetical protein FDUTEX481_04895 [Tolypothrix sp. PCC 7601]